MNKTENNALNERDQTVPAGSRERPSGKGRTRGIFRIATFALVVPVILLALVAGILIYLYQGERISNDTIHNQVQTAVQSVIGEEYRVEIGSTGLALVSSALVSLQGNDIRIFETDTNQIVATLDEIDVGLDPFSLFSEAFRFSDLRIDGGSIDLSAVKAKGPGAVGLSENLGMIARQAEQGSIPFRTGMIERISASNLTVNGLDLGRKAPEEPLQIARATIEGTAEKGIMLGASLVTRHSNPVLSARWTPGAEDRPGELTAGIGPINSLEFFSHADPIMALTEERRDGVGLQTSFRTDIRIAYDEFRPVDPFLKVQAEGGELRIGNQQTVPLNVLLANFRADFDRDLIILELGDISLGPVRFGASGLFRLPTPDNTGQALPLNLSLFDFSSTDSRWKEEHAIQSVTLDGTLDTALRKLAVGSLNITDVQSNRIGLRGEATFPVDLSPGLHGTAESANLPFDFLKNAWPFNLAPPVRSWLRENVEGGLVKDFSVRFKIEEGRLTEVDNGSGLLENELGLAASVSGVTVPTTGELPPLRQLSAELVLAGSKLTLNEARGVLQTGGQEAVPVTNASFIVEDMFASPPMAQISGRVGAPLRTLAALSAAKPLEIAPRLGVDPSALSGTANVNFALSVPLGKAVGTDLQQWSALVDLKDAASTKPLFGQSIEAANVSIDARQTLVSAKGTATINGFKANLDVSEPINGGPVEKRSRKISARLSTKALAAQGIDLNPIVSGPLGVKITTGADGLDRYEIDLRDADLSLPWIQWSKGSGIRSDASFILEQKGDTNSLRDFSITGPTYKAAGNLSFNKAGLISADLKNIVLVKGDLFDVAVRKDAGRYVINASGRSFDGRAVINKVIHGDGFGEDTATTDVSLTANFGRLAGFNNRLVENALVRYETNRGRLGLLQVRGAIDGGLSTIDAASEGNRTSFAFASDNAGGALAMVDLYRKMDGGELEARLVRTGNGPFVGKVKIDDFVVAGEDRLKSLVAAPPENKRLAQATGRLRELDVQRVRFMDLKADIEKADDLFVVRGGRLRNQQIGLTFDGTIYDPNDQMNVRGTFMPLFAVSRLIGGIPIIGDILSNGKDQGLIGITYRLKGPAGNPNMLVNPVSIIAPGVFRQIFQFQE